jgi:hypothetical protein
VLGEPLSVTPPEKLGSVTSGGGPLGSPAQEAATTASVPARHSPAIRVPSETPIVPPVVITPGHDEGAPPIIGKRAPRGKSL